MLSGEAVRSENILDKLVISWHQINVLNEGLNTNLLLNVLF